MREGAGPTARPFCFTGLFTTLGAYAHPAHDRRIQACPQCRAGDMHVPVAVGAAAPPDPGVCRAPGRCRHLQVQRCRRQHSLFERHAGEGLEETRLHHRRRRGGPPSGPGQWHGGAQRVDAAGFPARRTGYATRPRRRSAQGIDRGTRDRREAARRGTHRLCRRGSGSPARGKDRRREIPGAHRQAAASRQRPRKERRGAEKGNCDRQMMPARIRGQDP